MLRGPTETSNYLIDSNIQERPALGFLRDARSLEGVFTINLEKHHTNIEIRDCFFKAIQKQMERNS